VGAGLKRLASTLISWGPAGVFLLAILDSTGVPIPGGVDALLIFVAVLDHSGAYTAAAAAVVGSIIGSMVLFFIARKGGEQYLNRYTSRGRGARLKAWFLEYGLVTVFVPALVPIPMPLKIFILSAGALDINPFSFALVLAVARVPRYFFLAWLGTRLGDQTLPYLKSHVWELLAFSTVLFALLYLLIRVLDRKHKIARLTESE
jgi:membrane protein DedA with SNARE-associated domain